MRNHSEQINYNSSLFNSQAHVYESQASSKCSVYREQKYTKLSPLLNCLKESLCDHLSCPDHNSQELNYICCDQNCQSEMILLCLQCAKTHNPSHNILNLNQFIDFPLLGYVNTEESKTNKLLSELIQQSSVLLLKIKEQTQTSKNVLEEYLQNLMSWIKSQSEKIKETYNQNVEHKIQDIRLIMDQVQKISNIYNNELETVISEENIGNSAQLNEICVNFLRNSDSPLDTIKPYYCQLQGALQQIPELNVRGMKDLHFRIVDTFRFSYESLVSSKFIPSSDKLIEKLQASFKVQNIIDTQTQSPVSLLVKIDSDQFLTVHQDDTLNFISVEKTKVLNSLKREKLSSVLTLTDAQTILFGSEKGNFIEFFDLYNGKNIFREVLRPRDIVQIPGQQIVVADSEGRLHFYSYENLKKINQIGEFQSGLTNIVSIDFQLFPSGNEILELIHSDYNTRKQKLVGFSDLQALGVADASGNLIIFDLKNLSVLNSFNVYPGSSKHQNKSQLSQIKFISRTQDGQNKEHLLVCTSVDGTFHLWNLQNSEVCNWRVTENEASKSQKIHLFDEDKFISIDRENIFQLSSLSSRSVVGLIESPIDYGSITDSDQSQLLPISRKQIICARSDGQVNVYSI